MDSLRSAPATRVPRLAKPVQVSTRNYQLSHQLSHHLSLTVTHATTRTVVCILRLLSAEVALKNVEHHRHPNFFASARLTPGSACREHTPTYEQAASDSLLLLRGGGGGWRDTPPTCTSGMGLCALNLQHAPVFGGKSECRRAFATRLD